MLTHDENEEVVVDGFVDDVLRVKHNREIKPIFSCSSLSKDEALEAELQIIF